MNQHTLSRLILVAVIAVMLSACGGFVQSGLTSQLAFLDTTTAHSQTITEPTLPGSETAASQGQSIITLDLFAQQDAFVQLYEQVNPAVVHIRVDGGQGSGFVYDAVGYIVTNNHVVQGGRSITVTFADGREKAARLVGNDPYSDLAVIKVDAAPGELTPIPLGDSEALKVGQIVIAIGNPFGLQGSMTTGIISGLGRLLPGGQANNGGVYNIPNVIQTDAAINPGNSGGPLLDLHGRVIGINSAIESPVRASSGVGYAVPANIVSVVVPQLIASGRVTHPWLGISGGSLTSEIARTMGLNADQRGVFVSNVVAGGPAANAGLRAGNSQAGLSGDIIVSIDGRAVQTFDDLLGYVIQHTQVGQTVQLQVLRHGQVHIVPLTLAARPG